MPIRISKLGMTPCPACRTHVKVQDKDAVCPFCGAQLDTTGTPRMALGGRSGALAAGLLSLGIVACDDDTADGGGDDAVARDANTQDGASGEPDTGGAVDAMDAPDVAEADMILPAPLYGIAPVDGGRPAGDAAPQDASPADATVPDASSEQDAEMAVPLYGIRPAEAGGIVQDAALEPDLGLVPVPLYGIAPMLDAALPDAALPDAAAPQADAVVDAAPPSSDLGGGGPIVPLYGIPPGGGA